MKAKKSHWVLLTLDRRVIYAEGFPSLYYAQACVELLQHGTFVKGAELTVTNDSEIVEKAKAFSRCAGSNPLVV